MSTSSDLIATCWTSAGNVAPLARPDERSPFPIAERIAAVADAGWAGIGIAQDDLRHIRDTVGFGTVRQQIETAGLKYTEVEILTDWWETGPKRERSDEVRHLLFEAATALDARQIKVGTAFDRPLDSIEPLVAPLAELATEAGELGIRIALEPMPFSMVSNVPMGAELVRTVDLPNCGLFVDSWHVFRAGTALDELRDALTADIVFGVELNDADEHVVGTLFEDTINNRRLCGQGCFDLPGFVDTMRRIGFDGPWGVEIISERHRSLELAEALTAAFTTAREVVTSAPR